MRTLILAVSATAMAVPATMALPIDSAEAQRRYYDRNGNYNGPTWRGRTGTILGAAAGALLGREIQRSSSSRRCR